MTNTATTYVRAAKPDVGDTGWGETQNVNTFDVFDMAISGVATVSTTGGDTTLDDDDFVADGGKAPIIVVSGTLSSNANVIVPNRNRVFMVKNETSGAYTVSIKTASGSAVSVIQNHTQMMFCDGSDTITPATPSYSSAFDTFARSPTSANLAALVSGETGSGALVFGTSPTFIGTVTVGDGTTSGVVVRANGTVPTPSATAGLVVARNVLATTGAAIEVSSGNAGTAEVLFSDTDAISRGRVQYDHATEKMNFYTASAARATLDVTGFGIGTTSPSTKGHVKSASSIDGLTIESLNRASIWLTSSNGVAYNWLIQQAVSASSDLQVLASASGGGTPTQSILTLRASSNVGIGTTSPSTTLHVNGPVRTASYTVATLPAAGTVGPGTRAYVTDASATTFASTVAGGGANAVPVYSDGTNWKIG